MVESDFTIKKRNLCSKQFFVFVMDDEAIKNGGSYLRLQSYSPPNLKEVGMRMGFVGDWIDFLMTFNTFIFCFVRYIV